MSTPSIVSPRVAYLSMEIGLESEIPTYSGGLGVLAGDTLRAAADLGVPMVGVTLAHRRGYFRQHLDAAGQQTEAPDTWEPAEQLVRMDPVVTVEVSGRPVSVAAWRYDVTGLSGGVVPVFLLDTDVDGNDEQARTLTDQLYAGDERYRLAQEAILGLGGVAMLRALGFDRIERFHMNEGHAALITLALLCERNPTTEGEAADAIRSIRDLCVFTTHTPVPAGHDAFSRELVEQVLGRGADAMLRSVNAYDGAHLNMTLLALKLSRYVNGVAMRHGMISRDMFPGYPINSITNGIHAGTWASPSMQDLFDLHVPEWRRENQNLRHAVGIPRGEIAAAHGGSRRDLSDEVERRTGRPLPSEAFAIGFARRMTPYKRATLLFHDVERLREIARKWGPIAILYAGKAHPRDEGGKELIRSVHHFAAELAPDVDVRFLENYDMELGRLLCSGVDLWLNTPQKPQEASGTSGMKAALNGVPSLSILDGWWIEGHVEGATGWGIGPDWHVDATTYREAAGLYGALDAKILPLFRDDPDGYLRVRQTAIALNGSFFNAQRMLNQYVDMAYGLAAR